MKKKIALITGITGQDGSYLLEILLKKNYIVHGIKRKSSSFNTERIDHIYNDAKFKKRFYLHYGDLTDAGSLYKIINEIKPHEIYNLAAQSHVATSFDLPTYTSNVNALGALRILDSIRKLNLIKKTKFYQASSSELFGKIQQKRQSEKTPFYPLSPYAISKLFAFWITKNYRDSFGIFASNGILFNHESPRRGETFVTRKITLNLSKVVNGLEKSVKLGNLYSLRDWGHARDYAEMQWKILQQSKPDDFVVATENQMSVKKFVEQCLRYLKVKFIWKGKGLNERAIVTDFDQLNYPKLKKGQIIVEVDKKYFRPLDVDNLIGDAKKAKKILGWKPKYSTNDLIKEMMYSDLDLIKKKFI